VSKDFKSADKKRINQPDKKGKNLTSTKANLVVKTSISKLDDYFSKHEKTIIVLSCILTSILGILLFDMTVSRGGDDSTYLVKAFNFVHKFEYPSFQGPLYPILLSPVIIIFGLNLPVLKVVSLLFIVGHLIFLYRAFKIVLPGTIMFYLILMMALNSYILYFASQTYSEAAFMFLQSVFMYIFVRYFINEQADLKTFRFAELKKYLWFGLSLFALTLTRSIGYSALIAVVIYFAINKQWKNIIYTSGNFAFFFIIFEVIKRSLWKAKDLQFQTQFAGLLYKNYFNQGEGRETFFGFIQRFFDNSNLYISKHLYMVLGLRADDVAQEPFAYLTIIAYTVIVIAFVYIFYKNKAVMFAGLYSGISLTLSFIMLQKQWDQWRMLMPFYPLIFMVVISAIYYFTKEFYRISIVKYAALAIVVLLLFATLGRTKNRVVLQKDILSHALKGDFLYGKTPDWVNFIKMSMWAADNVDKKYRIGSRKPTISFIYSGGRDFYGIFNLPTINPDTLFKSYKQKKAPYIILKKSIVLSNDIPSEIVNACKANYMAILGGELRVPEKNGIHTLMFDVVSPTPDLIKLLDENKFQYTTNKDSVLSVIKNVGAEYNAISPDSLLNDLRVNNVRYVILANLRKYEQANSGEIINTIHRYFSFMQIKYPAIFRKEYQMGADNEEPSELIEVMY